MIGRAVGRARRHRQGLQSTHTGSRALELVLAQADWTHRRVESLAFEPNGETRRRLSWDFTLPAGLAIYLPGGRVAVPLATLRKEPLKRLDVRDAAGASLSVWGARENGSLAVSMLSAGLRAAGVHVDAPDVQAAVRRVVFSDGDEGAEQDADLLSSRLSEPMTDHDRDLQVAVRSLIAMLRESFLFVVEVPDECVGRRTVIKASYEDDRSKRSATSFNLDARSEIEIETNGGGHAESWHLEVQAPQGLRVDELRYESWDPVTTDLTAEGVDYGHRSTAHVTARELSPYDDFSCFVRFAPDRSALLNQISLGAFLGTLLLWTSVALAESIAARTATPGTGASLGAVLFSLPALFFALLSRGREHALVSQVLLGPRLASLGCALTLWAAGLAVVWRPPESSLELVLTGLAVCQTAMFGWLLTMRAVGAAA